MDIDYSDRCDEVLDCLDIIIHNINRIQVQLINSNMITEESRVNLARYPIEEAKSIFLWLKEIQENDKV